uniref:Protein BUD31-like protein n=1 Tax=Aegilops tauschii subsp. strangulata TaxID=200361 RepID=A0A453DU34_AEGTS
MPKIKLGRVEYTEGWVLIEPTIRELDAKIREAENDTHDRKRKCEALYPIFRISRSHYIYDLFYRRRKDISNELYVFCLDQGYADRNLIVKWKRSVASTFMYDCTIIQVHIYVVICHCH